MNNTATAKYEAVVSYPNDPNVPFEYGYGATIMEAERAAIEQSAVNVTRRVCVNHLAGDLRLVKGPYILRANKAVL